MEYQIVRRDEWGALPQATISPDPWEPGPLVVHHSDGPSAGPNAELRQDASLVRGIDRFHYYTRGWSGGVGYSYLVTEAGRIFEGRGPNTVGAHTVGQNDHLPAVCAIGSYQDAPPSPLLAGAIVALARMLGRTALAGHRDYNPTGCPGDALYRDLPRLATLVRSRDEPLPVQPPPHGRTLRLTINGETFAGWAECSDRLRWIARHGLDPKGRHAIAWSGHVWRGADQVRGVARNLSTRYLNG